MRILYLYTKDWSREIADYYRGVVPSHRIFGFAELRDMGHQPVVCSLPERFKKWKDNALFWKLYQLWFALTSKGRTDCVFAINEAAIVPLLVFKRLGLYRRPVIIFNTGLMHPRNRSGLRRRFWGWILPCAEAVVSQTKMELESVPREFGLALDRQFLIHMLVDTKFFKPEPAAPKADYCLSVGTNEAKDFPTLLKAFPRDRKLIVVTDAYNAAIIERHREPGMPVEVLQAVPIAKLRSMYREARVIINPLAETDYGSGHTVVLENMVLGNPVIVTKVGGMIDYYEEDVSAISVLPNNVEDMRAKITAYLEAPEKFAHVGSRAQEWVRRFSSEEFARRVVAIAEGLLGREKSPDATSPDQPVGDNPPSPAVHA
jgi:glycosyltransferase involved in cell wall biosynthesis